MESETLTGSAWRLDFNMRHLIASLFFFLTLSYPIFPLTLSERENIGAFGQGDGQFREPAGITKLNGSLLIVDRRNQRVQRFTTGLTFEYAFKKILYEYGDNATMESPLSIAADERGAIYVLDSGPSVIYHFDSYGRYINTIGRFGAFGTKFNGPTGIAVDLNGLIYVADFGNNRILVLDAEGKKVSEIKGFRDPLNRPSGVIVTAEGAIFVLDSDGVKQFDSLGKFQKRLVSYPTGTSFTIDSKGQVYIADLEAQSIKIFDVNGTALMTFSAVKKPTALYIDGTRLYISDADRHQVRIYESE